MGATNDERKKAEDARATQIKHVVPSLDFNSLLEKGVMKSRKGESRHRLVGFSDPSLKEPGISSS